HDFLMDVERIRAVHDVWVQTPASQQAGALLHGILLSRARDWLLKYPQRFLSTDMEPLRVLIDTSARSEDIALARSLQLRRRLFQGVTAAAVVFAVAALVAGSQYWRAEHARSETELARQDAEHNFAIAERAADDLVNNLARGLPERNRRTESERR